MKKIYFRADGNANMGLGHIIRSLALAEMLNEEFDCYFIIQNPLSDIVNQILDVCNGIIQLSSSKSSMEEANRIINNYLKKDDIIILDGYHFKTSYQQILKNHGCKVICIDDIHAYHFVADAVINHALGIKEKDYSAETYTQFHLGLKYALLRPPFLKAAKEKQLNFATDNIFICLGGADPNNDTLDILNKCDKKKSKETYYVIVGGANPHKKELLDFQKKTKLNLELLFNLSAEEMVSIMKKCSKAITSPSTIAIEYLCIGGQLFLKTIADNQKDIYKYLIQSEIAHPIKEFFSKQKASKRKSAIDGNQPKRFINLIKNLYIQFEKPTVDHCSLYYEWTNDPETRKQSLNSDLIPLDTHVKWFKKKLKDNNSLMLLGMLDKKPIGQVRLEFKKEEALINYSVAPKFRGRGIGYSLLQKIIPYITIHHPSIKKLIGFVKKENKASLHIFRRLEFQENIQTDKYQNLHKFSLFL